MSITNAGYYPQTELQNGNLQPVGYTERPGSPQESYVNNEGKVTRVFDVRWDSRGLFYDSLLGYSQVAYNRGQPYVSRVPPITYFDDQTNEPWLYATSIERVEGVGFPSSTFQRGQTLVDNNNIYQYEIARITVGYQALTYRVMDDKRMLNQATLIDDVDGVTYAIPAATDAYGNPDESSLLRYVSRHIQPNTEYLRLPGGQMKWATNTSGGNTNVSSGALGMGKIISTAEIQYTWHQVPIIPDHIYKYVGCVNNDGYLTSQGTLLDMPTGPPPFSDNCPGLDQPRNFAPGTLLLTGIELKPYRQITGHYAYDITYRMKFFSALLADGTLYNPERGHNYFLRWQGGSNYGYELLTADGTVGGRTIYDAKLFANLFRLYEVG
jgi:hypothetical protein